jgi:hypothetical protein
MMHLTDGIQVRLVGREVAPSRNAQAARPSLEDGYVWLMQEAARRSSAP